MRDLAWSVSLVVALGMGCGDDDGGSDAGDVDTGMVAIDSGPSDVDSGPSDVDSGPSDVDSGPADVDAGMAMCLAADAMGCASSSGGMCCAGLVCCSGVPEPADGRCAARMSDCLRSDRNLKHGFASVDREEVLAKVAALEISTWSYDDEPGVRHMGPMAQDFRGAFGLGADDRHIFTLDANGVTMASIQALAARTETLARQNEALRRENEAMHDALRRIEARLGTGER